MLKSVEFNGHIYNSLDESVIKFENCTYNLNVNNHPIEIPKLVDVITRLEIDTPNDSLCVVKCNDSVFMNFLVESGKHLYPFILPIGDMQYCKITLTFYDTSARSISIKGFNHNSTIRDYIVNSNVVIKSGLLVSNCV